MQTASNIKFFLDRCEYSSVGNEVTFLAPDQLVAEGLRKCAFELAEWLQEQGKNKAVIKWLGDEIGYDVFSWFAASSSSNKASVYKVSKTDSVIVVPEDQDSELAMQAYSDKKQACWIIDQHTQEVLLANRVALDANHKPPRDLLGKDISALWQEEALRELTNLVSLDRVVHDHTNQGFRWGVEGDQWFRRKHTFCVDYKLVNFLGRTARFEVVKEAVVV